MSGPIDPHPVMPVQPLHDLRGPTRPTNVRWRIFALACGTSFLLYLHRYTWNYIAPELEREYGYSHTSVQAIGSLFNWTYGAGQLPSGVLCDLIGPHLFLGALILLWSATLPAHLLAGNVKALAAARLLFGAAQAGAYPSLGKATQGWFPPASRTIVQGWIATAFGRGGGAMSSILLGSVLIGGFGLTWQQSLLVVSAAGIVFGILFLVAFRNSPQSDPRVNDAERVIINEGRLPVSTGEAKVLPWRQALKNRSLVACLVQQFHAAGADSFYSQMLGIYFIIGWRLSAEDASVPISLPLFGGAIGGMVGAYLNDFLIVRLGNRRWARSAVGACGAMIAAGLILLVIVQPTAWAAAITLFFVKFFMDWNQPTTWGTATDLGGRYTATVFSIINTSGTLGSMFVPPALGAILDYTMPADSDVPRFEYVIACIAAMYLVSAVSWLWVDCTRGVDAE